MPQMAPYNWFILFFLFNLIMIIYMSINYFSFSNSPTFNPLIPSTNNFRMKW